jgi:hypothetical protein
MLTNTADLHQARALALQAVGTGGCGGAQVILSPHFFFPSYLRPQTASEAMLASWYAGQAVLARCTASRKAVLASWYAFFFFNRTSQEV